MEASAVSKPGFVAAFVGPEVVEVEVEVEESKNVDVGESVRAGVVVEVDGEIVEVLVSVDDVELVGVGLVAPESGVLVPVLVVRVGRSVVEKEVLLIVRDIVGSVESKTDVDDGDLIVFESDDKLLSAGEVIAVIGKREVVSEGVDDELVEHSEVTVAKAVVVIQMKE